MNKKACKYPQKIQFSKLSCKVAIVLAVFLLIPLILKNNEPTDFGSIFEYFLAMSLPPLLIVFSCVCYLGSWADLEVSDNGIYIEFLWKKIHVPWSSIITIKSIGLGFVRIDVVLVDHSCLTIFHRIYSLFTVVSIRPGFHIHPHFLQSHELYKLIHKYRSEALMKQ